jgi:hypothetical protein
VVAASYWFQALEIVSVVIVLSVVVFAVAVAVVRIAAGRHR